MVMIEFNQSSQKEKIADHFNKGVHHYLSYSQVQKHCANQLLNILKDITPSIPNGPILEIGCGTGFVTQGLIEQFPNRFLDIIDISPEMLHYCQKNLQISDSQKPLIQFKQMDGEALDVSYNTYAAMISSFTVQWFQDIFNSFRHLIKTLLPHGIFLMAFPNDKSFPEWKNVCDALNLPFTRNQLPNTEELIQHFSLETNKTYVYETQIKLTYRNANEFFKSLKVIGAGLNLNNQKLSIPEMKKLIHYWNNNPPTKNIEVTYFVTFLVMIK